MKNMNYKKTAYMVTDQRSLHLGYFHWGPRGKLCVAVDSVIHWHLLVISSNCESTICPMLHVVNPSHFSSTSSVFPGSSPMLLLPDCHFYFQMVLFIYLSSLNGSMQTFFQNPCFISDPDVSLSVCPAYPENSAPYPHPKCVYTFLVPFLECPCHTSTLSDPPT